MSFMIETSARHIHLTQETVEKLFGAGYQLTIRKPLSYPGQYACNERLTIVGPKKEMANVSILGPTRKADQVEVSATDARTLGIDAPIRESGDVKGSGACKLIGPAGEVELSEGVIVAKRHLHVTEEDAAAMGIKNGEIIKVAVIGKPNVGKSSLVNLILGEKRVIVSNVAGTTRDSVDSRFENKYGKYIFVDTAGIRRKSRVDDRIEKFSVMRAKLAIERADVCLIMIDARDGVTEQDTKIAGLAHEAGKASIIVVNKWDLVDKETGTMEKMRKDVLRDLSFMSYAPVLFISALTGQRTERLFELINFVNDQSAMRITTGMLNNVLADAQARVQPPTDKGRRLKIYYMTQSGVRPPTFVCFCNDAQLFHFSYQRYLENQIRAVFGLEGTPIRMVIRQKGEQE